MSTQVHSHPDIPTPASVDFYLPRDEGINGLGGFYRLDDQMESALDDIISSAAGVTGHEQENVVSGAFPRYSISSRLGRGAMFISYDNEPMNAISRRAFSDGVRFFIHRDLVDELNVASVDADRDGTGSLVKEWMADALLLGACNVMGVEPIGRLPRSGVSRGMAGMDYHPPSVPAVPEHLSAHGLISWVDPARLRDIVIKAYGASASLSAIDEALGETDELSNQAMVKTSCQDYLKVAEKVISSLGSPAVAHQGGAIGFGEHLHNIQDAASALLLAAQQCKHLFLETPKDTLLGRAFFLSPQDQLTLFKQVGDFATTRDITTLTAIFDSTPLMMRNSLAISIKREASLAGRSLTQDELVGITQAFVSSNTMSQQQTHGLIDALSGYDSARGIKISQFQERACAAGLAGKSQLGLHGQAYDRYIKVLAEHEKFRPQIMITSCGSLYPSHTDSHLLDKCRKLGRQGRPWEEALIAHAPTDVMREALSKMDEKPALGPRLVIAACSHYNAIEHVKTLLNAYADTNSRAKLLDQCNPNTIVEALLSHLPARKEEQLHDLLVYLQEHGLDLSRLDAHAIQLPQGAHAKVAPDPVVVHKAKASWEALRMDQQIAQSPSRPRTRL